MQKVNFESNGVGISATLAMPDIAYELLSGVVIFHGMTSSENSAIPLAASLADIGIAGLSVSMRGHGESGGDFSQSTVAEATGDGLAAYDFLANTSGIDSNRIGIVGTSVGAILAATTSEQRDVKSMVFRSPAAYTDEMMHLTMAEIMHNEGRLFHEIRDIENTPAGRAVAKFTGSLLVVASEKDAIIPPTISNAYLVMATAAFRKKLVVLEGAPHDLTGTKWKDVYYSVAREWLSDTLLR